MNARRLATPLVLLLALASVCGPSARIQVGRPLDRGLAGATPDTFEVMLRAGEFVRIEVLQRDGDVVVDLLDPEGALLASEDANAAPESELIEADAKRTGIHKVRVSRFEDDAAGAASHYTITLREVQPAAERAHVLAEERAEADSAAAWIAAHAIPIATVEAGHGFEDLESLRQVVGDARIVGLGEATHGTREFFQLKHRLLEFLASRMGFTAFAIEATMPEGFDIDDYVVNGRGDPAQALSGLYFWTWNTEEVLDLLRWMRRWNADPAHRRKLHFYGVDMQAAPRAVRVVLDYLHRVDELETPRADAAFASLADPFLNGQLDTEPLATRARLRDEAARLVLAFDSHRPGWVAKTSAADWARARQHAVVLSQNLEMRADSSGGYAVRDRAMAENTRWVLDQEGPEGRVVLWAHNGHVANDTSASLVTMGGHLRRRFGDRYVVFGFTFDRGGFQAIEASSTPQQTLHRFSVDPAPSGSVDGMLARSAPRLAAVDLRTLPPNGAAARWFDRRHPTRGIGALYSDSTAGQSWVSQRVKQLYDALLFVDSTTAARPNRGGVREANPPLVAPANLSFQSVGTDGMPTGWWLPDTQRDLGFAAAVVTHGPVPGKPALELWRRPGPRYGEMMGTLTQAVDATAYRGQHVRLTMMAQAAPGAGTGAAYVSLTARGAGFQPSPKSRKYAAVNPGAWQPITLVLEVPSDALSLSYGLSVTGEMRARIGPVTVEAIERAAVVR